MPLGSRLAEPPERFFIVLAYDFTETEQDRVAELGVRQTVFRREAVVGGRADRVRECADAVFPAVCDRVPGFFIASFRGVEEEAERVAFISRMLFIAFEVKKAVQVHGPGVHLFRSSLQKTGRFRMVRFGPAPLPQQDREVRHAFRIAETGSHLVPRDRFRRVLRDTVARFRKDAEADHGTGVPRHGGFFIPFRRFFIILRGPVPGLAAEADLVHAVDIAALRGFPVVFERFFEIFFHPGPEVITVSEQEVGPREPVVRREAEQTDGLFPVFRDAFSVEVQDTEEAVRFRDTLLGGFFIESGRLFEVPLHAGSGLKTEAQHEQGTVVAAFGRFPVEFQRFLIVSFDTAAEEIEFRQLEGRFDGPAVHRRRVAEHRLFQVLCRPDAVLIAGAEGAERQRVFVVRRLFQEVESRSRVLFGADAVHIAKPQPVVRFRAA